MTSNDNIPSSERIFEALQTLAAEFGQVLEETVPLDEETAPEPADPNCCGAWSQCKSCLGYPVDDAPVPPLGGVYEAYRMNTLEDWVGEVYEVNSANGWFDTDRPLSADIALLHSEASEAYEAVRNSDTDNFREELADIFIRLADTAKRTETDLAYEVAKKLERNRSRGYRHGGKAE